MSSLYLSQMRQNPQYQNVSAMDLGRMVYDQDKELQQISFDQFMPLFNDTGEPVQAQQAQPQPQQEDNGTDWGQFGLDAVDVTQAGLLNVGSSFAEGMSGLAKWATGEESETAGNIANYLKEQADDQMTQMSESNRTQMQNTGVELGPDGMPKFTEGSTLVGGLLNTISGVATSVPYMLGGGLVAKGLSTAGRAAGGLVMPSVARKAALNLPAGKVPQAAAMAGMGGIGIGGGSKQEAYNKAYNASTEELNKHPAYQAAYWKIADTYKAEGTEATHEEIAEQARVFVAEAASDDGFADGFSLGAVSMGILGPMFLNNVLGRVSGGITKRAIKGAAIEGTQELVESGGQAYLTNQAVNKNADRSVQPMDNVVNEALTGTLFGASAGGSMSAVGGIGSKITGITKEKDMPGYGDQQEYLFQQERRAAKEQSELDETLQALKDGPTELVGDTETVDPKAPDRLEDSSTAPMPEDANDEAVKARVEELIGFSPEAAAVNAQALDMAPSPVEESTEKANYRADLQIALDIALAQSKNRKLAPEARKAASDRIASIQEEINNLDEILPSTPVDLGIETSAPTAPASNPAITKRILEWSKVQPDKDSDRFDEQRVYKDAIIRELKSLMKMEVGSDQAFRKEESIRMMEEKFNALAPTPLNEVPRYQQALEAEDAVTEAQLQEYGQMEDGTVNVYDATGKPYSARVVRVSDQGTTVVENQAGEEVILGMDLSALDVNANDPNYKVNAKGSKYNDATISSLSDAELTELIGDETALEGGGSRVTVDSITNINAAKLELRKRNSNLDQETAPTGDNLYDVFANQETNPFASTDLFGRLQPIEEDGIAVDLQGVVRDNMNSLRANGTPDDKKLNRKAVNKILTKDTEYIETLTKTSAINNTVRRQYRKINAELGKASADYYIQSLGRAMGLFSSPTPTKLAMYDEYVEGLNDNVVPLVYEVWEETIYQKGKAPSLTAKKPSPQPVEEPVEATQPETEPEPDPTPPKKTVPKADKTTDASAKKSAAGKKTKGNKAVLEEIDEAVIEEPTEEFQAGGQQVVEVLISDITISEDVPQFKDGADNEGVVDPLGGTFDRVGVAPIQIWLREDGRKEVISGRHRLDLAKRSNETTIPAQYHLESEGFGVDQASMLDVLLNIREGQGTVKDYVEFIQGTQISEEEADRQGILARQTGRRAYTIASEGSPALVAAHRADQISDIAATQVSQAAPNNETLQAVGLKALQEGKSITVSVNIVKAVNSMTRDTAQESGDLFGFDDSAMKEAENLARKAVQKQAEIQRTLTAVTGASNNPELAKAEGVNVKDPEAVRARIEELKDQKREWQNWHTNPALVAELTGNEVATPVVAETTDDEVAAPALELSTQTEEDLATKAERDLDAGETKEQVDREVDGFSLDGGVSLTTQADPVQNPQANDLFEGNTDVNEVEDPVSTNEVVDSSPDDPVQDTTEVVAKAAAEVAFDLKDVGSTSNNDPSDLVNDDRVLQFVVRGDGLKLALYVGEKGTDDVYAQVFATQDAAVEEAMVLERKGLGLYRPTATLGLFGEQKSFVLDALIPSKKMRTDEPMAYDNKTSAENALKTIGSNSAYDVQKSQVSDDFFVVTSVSRMDTVGKSEEAASTDVAVTEPRNNLQENIENSGLPYVLAQTPSEKYPNQPQLFMLTRKSDPLFDYIKGDSMEAITEENISELLDVDSDGKSDTLIAATEFANLRINTVNALLASGEQQGKFVLEEGKDRLEAVSIMFNSVSKFDSIENDDGSVTLMGDTSAINEFLSSHKKAKGKEDVLSDGDTGLLVGIKVSKANSQSVRGKLKNQALYFRDGEIDGAVHVINPTKALFQAKVKLERENDLRSDAAIQEEQEEDAAIEEAGRAPVRQGKKTKANDGLTTEDIMQQLEVIAADPDLPPLPTKEKTVDETEAEAEAESETSTVSSIDPFAEFLGETTLTAEEDPTIDDDQDWGDLNGYADNTDPEIEIDPADATADQDQIDQLQLGLKDAKSNSKDTTLNAADRKAAKALIPKIEKALVELGVVVKKSKPASGITNSDIDDIFDVADILGRKFVSRSQLRNTNGMSVASVQSVINNFEAKYNGIPDIKYNIINTPVPDGAAVGSLKNKVVTLNAAGINNTAELESVLRHEILAHYGLSVFTTLEEKMDILNRVSKAEGQNKEMTLIFDNVRTRYKPYIDGWKNQGATDESIESSIAEEVFARVAEEADQSKFGKAWDAIVSYVMKALRKVGFYEHYTKADVRRTLQSFGKQFTEADVETSLQVNGKIDDIKFNVPASEDGLDASMEALLANVAAQTEIRVAAEAAEAAQAEAIEAVQIEQLDEQRKVIVAESKPSRNLGDPSRTLVGIPTQRIATETNLAKGRLPAVEVRPDIIPDRATINDHSSVYADSLDAGQRMGVDLALSSMMEKNYKGFLLADGTGFGKTRQILAIADQYKKSTGKKVLIISEKPEILKKNFAEDAAIMGIDMNQFKTGTYNSFKDGKKGNAVNSEFDQDWGMVLFDEAHNLKNYDTIQAKASRGLRKEKVVYVTATPMDRASSGANMWAQITGETYEKALDRLGHKLATGKKVKTKSGLYIEGPKEVVLKKGVSPKRALEKVAEMRDFVIESGRMLKRYYPFFGTTNDINVQMTEEARIEQSEMDQWWSSEMAAKGNPSTMKGQRINEFVRWEEHLKLDATVEQLKEDLANGKQVIVAAETVSNDLTIKGLDDKKIMGFIGLMKERLDSEGINYTELTGDTKDERKENVAEFQEGKAPVALITAASGGTGINLDDVVGDTPRSLIMVTKNWSGDKVVQLIGRVSRKNTQSASVVHVVNLEGGIGDEHKSLVVKRKLNTLLSSSGEPSIFDSFEWEGTRIEDGELVVDEFGRIKGIDGGLTPQQIEAVKAKGGDLGSVEVKPAIKPEAGDTYRDELRRHGANPTTAETAKGKKYLSLTATPANRASIEATLRRILPLDKKGNESAFITPKSRNGETFFYVWQTAHAKAIATDLNDRGVVYSRQSVSEKARGLSSKSVKDVQKWVGNSVLANMSKLGHSVEVVQSVSDIPTAGLNADIDPTARGLFIPNSMTSYLVADNIHSKSEARTVFSHEVVGHYGIQSMLGDEFNSILEEVQDMKANGDPEVVAAAEVVMNREGQLSREQEAEEIIAVMAEGLESRSLMTRVYDAIRMWMKRTFSSNYIASNGNLRDLVLDAKRHVYTDNANANTAPQTAGQILYSKVSKLDAPKQMEVFADSEENVGKILGGLAAENFRKSTVDSASKVINQNKNRNFLQYWLTNTQIFRTYKAAFDWKDGNPLKTINNLLGEFRVDKERALHGFEKEEKIWDKLSTKEANSLASLMRDSTIAGIHPDESMANKVHEFVRLDQNRLDKLKAKPKKTKVDMANISNLEESLAFMQSEHARLRKEWNKLTANAKLVYDDTLVMLREQYEMEQSELLARIDRQIENPVHRESAKKALKNRMGELIKRGPYFPLSRFGNHVVIAFAEINGKREFVREQFESRTEAERALKWHKSKWGEDNARMTYMADMGKTAQSGDLFSFRDNLFTALDENRDGVLRDEMMDENARSSIRASTEQLKTDINNLMLNTLPSSSIMQRRRQRLGTKGASSDMRRSVQNMMLQSAQQISKIKYADRIQSELNDIGLENRKFATGEASQVTQQYADIASATHAEMTKRFELTMNPTGAAWASNAGRLAFFHYLGWSPAAAFVNLTQVPTIAIPIVGARYGLAKTSAVFLKTMTDWHLGKSELSLRDAYKSFARDGNKNVTADEQNFIKVLIDRGDIDITRVGSITEEAHSDQRTPSVFGTKMQKLMRTGAYMFHGAEMSNREVTGLATYRLIKDKHPELFKGSTFKSSEEMSENELKIYDEVRELIGETQFLYESENRPRAMRENNIIKSMTTFKIYGQHVIYMYSQLAREALGRDKSLSPEKRREAMKALAGLVTFQMLAAGATGVLPIAVAVWMGGVAYNLFADDEEEIVSSEVEFTQWLDDLVRGMFDDDEQQFMSALLSKGLGNALGVDIASRTGQNTNLLIMMPDRPMSSGKEYYKELLLSVAGPVFGGIGGSTFNFAQDVYEGNPTNNLKSALPKVVRDAYKAVDYSKNGVKTRNDLEVIDSLDTSDIVIQALGFTPEVVSSTYSRAFAGKNKSEQQKAVRRNVLGDVYTAISGGDQSDVQDALAAVTRWNNYIMERINDIKDPAMKYLVQSELITSKTLLASLKSKVIMKASAIEGVVLPKKHLYLINEYTFGKE